MYFFVFCVYLFFYEFVVFKRRTEEQMETQFLSNIYIYIYPIIYLYGMFGMNEGWLRPEKDTITLLNSNSFFSLVKTRRRLARERGDYV